jgi:DNA-binding GntR family transcriptional regulator
MDLSEPRVSGQPATFKSLTAAVANALQQDLVAGRYMPGEKLPIVRLAKDYGVSPGAVREALSRLISEGLVEFNEQRGFRAAPVSPAALLDITRTRIMIDDVDWEAEVLAIQHRLANCVVREEHDPSKVREEWQRLHRIFHRTLIAACGSSWLMRFHDLLFDQTIRYRSVAAAYELQRQDLRSGAAGEHARIVEAVIARDADAAAAAIEKHYMTTASVIIEAPELVAGSAQS